MDIQVIYAPNKKDFQIAGIWYIAAAIFYSFSMIYVDSLFYVPNDIKSTISNIIENEFLFLLGIFSCLIGHICFLFLGNAIYRLFSKVDSDLSRQMVTLMNVGVSVAFLNRLNQFATYTLINASFGITDSDALAMVFLQIHKYGEMMASIFWGLWFIPLALLIWKSGFGHKLLAIMLIVTCFCYLVDVVIFFFSPHLIAKSKPMLSFFEVLSEIVLILWLLVKGATQQKPFAG